MGTPTRLAQASAAVRAAVLDESIPPRLSETAYLRTQKIYEAHSDQRVRIAQWLADCLPAVNPARTTIRVLSIGCGDGTLDAALALTLTGSGRRLEYVGIEPSSPAGNTFLERLGALPNVTPKLINSTLEQADPDHRFDLVVAIHSLYYVQNLPAQMQRLVDMVDSGGSLVIMNAPLLGLNTLVEAMALPEQGTSLIYSDEIKAILDALQVSAPRQRIDAALDVSPCRDPNSEIGRDILQFLTHANVTARSPEFRDLLVDYLEAIALVPGGSLVPHPVDVFVATDPAPRPA